MNPRHFLLALSALPFLAATYHVSPDGADTAPGTINDPWRTFTHAAATAIAGDTVEFASGVYPERVTFSRSGTAVSPITFRAATSATPILDGTSLTPPADASALLNLPGISHVHVEGFELRNYRTATRNHVPIGILVDGAGTGVRLERNHIHHIETNVTTRNGGDAHGIAIFGTATNPITDIVIRNNHLHDLKLGSSEALVLNGNVTDFLVESNRVHDCNNIGIDFIGHEGTAPTPDLDAARNGIARLNVVTDITAYGNPAYGNNYGADGIYVDGGRDILIEQNTVARCDIGIECASEHAGLGTTRIHVRNNLVYNNTIGGIFLGGYDTQRGYTDGCIIEHNTLYHNDTRQDGNGEIYLQYDVRDSTFRHNLIVTNSQGLVVGNPYTQNTNNTFDYNLISTPTGTSPEWQWKNKFFTTLAAWRTASGGGTHSATTADPRFLDATTGDFTLRPKSPAIDTGDPAFSPATNEADHAKKNRVLNDRTDIGAYEFDLENFAAAGQPTALQLDHAHSTVTYTRRSDWQTQSLVFEIQTNPGLDPDQWLPTSGTPTRTATPDPPDGTERVTFEVSIPSAPRAFARLRLAISP